MLGRIYMRQKTKLPCALNVCHLQFRGVFSITRMDVKGLEGDSGSEEGLEEALWGEGQN